MPLYAVQNIMEEKMNKDTLDKMIVLKMPGMAEEYRRQSDDRTINELTFEERLALLVDCEWDSRRTHKMERLIKNADFPDSQAMMERILYYEDRHLNRDQLQKLATCSYIEAKENVIIIGATGAGKTYIASALGVEACRKGRKVKYVRLQDLLSDLSLAKEQNTYKRTIKKYAKLDLLIIDEWLLIPTESVERQDLLEILEYRYRTKATIFCSYYQYRRYLH